jgi:hypothetical protein
MAAGLFALKSSFVDKVTYHFFLHLINFITVHSSRQGLSALRADYLGICSPSLNLGLSAAEFALQAM